VDFGLSEDQSMFAQWGRRGRGAPAPLERVRAIMESKTGHDAGLLGQLAEQGVTGVLVPAEHGGADLGLLDAVIAAEELGAAVAPLNFHTACVMAPLALAAGGSDEHKRRWLPAIAAGEALLSFVDHAPAVERSRLSGRVLFVPDAQAADAFVVCAGGNELICVAGDTPGLSVEPLATVDDTRRVGELVLEDVKVDASMRLDCDDAAIARVLDAGRIALAADTLGAAERALERAVAFSLGRKQFERVIGSFQAVKHMCAETAADVEPLRSLVWYAAFAWDQQRDDAPAVAASLKAHAGDVGVKSTTTCVQVFGGMGFTWECDAHLWFKRAGYNRQMLGSPAEMRARAADLVLASV
jgi:alkylation response protein AidB-like acyl-CoA dehydrogenase